jgi:hypothetical protein
MGKARAPNVLSPTDWFDTKDGRIGLSFTPPQETVSLSHENARTECPPREKDWRKRFSAFELRSEERRI